jgi:hypothetical protein
MSAPPSARPSPSASAPEDAGKPVGRFNPRRVPAILKPMLALDKAAVARVPFYCEENVWQLLARPELYGRRTWVLIASSRAKSVIVMRQRAGRPVDGLIRWDYHVLALVEDRQAGFLALDPDSDLPFPGPARAHVEASFPSGVQPALAPRFRLVEAAEYLGGLVTDRSHMRRPDGSWLAPPPSWPCPGEKRGTPSNLMEWIDMGRRKPGRLYDLPRLLAFLAGGCA